MTKLFSAEQMRKLDADAGACDIPSLLLMEHAGDEVARAVRELVSGIHGKNVTVICGPGNNGGDGFVAARILNDYGANVSLFLRADPGKLKGDAARNHAILQKIFIPASDPIQDKEAYRRALQGADCIVDALFGTGLKRPIEKETAWIIETLNASGKPVVAVDVPSGLEADSGKILGAAVRASVTVTLAGAKVGLFLYPGREHAGKIKVVRIGIPEKLMEQAPCDAFLTEAHEVASMLPIWKPDIHKGERGRVMIIGGSRGLSGAPALAATAAQESGAGLVYLAVPDGIRTLMEHKLTEAVKVGLPQTREWVLGTSSLPETRKWFERIHALGIGPGIGREKETGEFVRAIITEYGGPMVIDADGLYALDDAFLKEHGRVGIVLTPHEGEMARLCGTTAANVRENRLSIAREKARAWRVTLILKGASTLVASSGRVFVNPTGNPGMATGGAGDVLTGLTVSLLGQGMSPLDAAVSAAFIHGLAGDILQRETGVRGITAEKIAAGLYKAFRELENTPGALA